MLLTVPAVDASLCCCHLVEPSLGSSQHQDDCELLDSDPKMAPPLHAERTASGTSANASEDHGTARRRRHRESMARLRQTWRASIASLQRQEIRLRSELRDTMAHTTSATNQDHSDDELADSFTILRRSYAELVQEQLRLQDEQTTLEAACDHNEKYERLLERELERTRTFRAITDSTTHESS